MDSLTRRPPRRLPIVCRLTAVLAVLGGLSWAAAGHQPLEAQTVRSQPQSSQAKPPEQGGLVVLKRADCARLQAYQPAPDVAYQPGVDVRGRPVAPADLPGTPQIVMPDEITIAITVELQSRFGIPATSSLYKPEASIGTVVVKPDGSATFNGQPLTSQEQSALAYLCQRQGPLAR